MRSFITFVSIVLALLLLLLGLAATQQNFNFGIDTSDESLRDMPYEERDQIREEESRFNMIHRRQVGKIFNGEAVPYPVVGVVTTPRSPTSDFPFPEYVIRANNEFLALGGSFAVPIPYDIDDLALYELLPKLNGVFLTGGWIELIDADGTQHPLYKTAKKTYNYSIMMKDEKNISYPIFGICQGYEVLSVIASGDDRTILQTIKENNVNLNLNWSVDPQTESKMFENFPPQITEEMAKENILFHFHIYSVATETFKSNQGLLDTFKVLATYDDVEQPFVVAIEGKKYPFYGIQFHVEFAFDHWTGGDFRPLQTAEAQQVEEMFAFFVNEIMQTNEHHFDTAEQCVNHLLDNFPLDTFILEGATSKAYGLEKPSE